MKKPCLPLLIASVFALCGAPAVSPRTSAGSATEAEVLAAIAARDKAFVAGDEKTVAQFMAEDYLQTDVLGHVQDKATWMKEYFDPIGARIRSGGFRWVVFRKSDVQVRDLGNVVVAIGTLTLKPAIMRRSEKGWAASPQDDNRPPGFLRFTQVWIKRDGVWKLVVVHNAYTNAEGFQREAETRKKMGPR